MEPLEYAKTLAHEAYVDVDFATSLMEDVKRRLDNGHPEDCVSILEHALLSAEKGQHHINDTLRQVRELITRG